MIAIGYRLKWYEEISELTDEMLERGVFKRAGRPVASDPRLQVTIRLPGSVIAIWKASRICRHPRVGGDPWTLSAGSKDTEQCAKSAGESRAGFIARLALGCGVHSPVYHVSSAEPRSGFGLNEQSGGNVHVLNMAAGWRHWRPIFPEPIQVKTNRLPNLLFDLLNGA
ncbi:MAG: hypothetical protein ABIQ62_06045, partial [Thermomonas sp.]